MSLEDKIKSDHMLMKIIISTVLTFGVMAGAYIACKYCTDKPYNSKDRIYGFFHPKYF